MNYFQPILYDPSVLGFTIAIMPIFITIAATLFALYNHHVTFDFNNLPMISNIMVQLPEKRVYSVGLNLTAWLALPVFLIIDRILKLKCKIEKCHKEPIVYCLRWVMNICAGFSFFGMLGMASVSINELPRFRQICYQIMIVFLTIYYALVDYEMIRAKLNVTLLNRIWTFIGLFLAITSYLFTKYSGQLSTICPSINYLSIAALCQYFHIPFLSLKFLLIWHALPKCGVLVSKNKDE